MFSLHYPIFILSLLLSSSSDPQNNCALEWVPWFELCSGFQYLHTQTLRLYVKVGKIESACFVCPAEGSPILFSLSSWGSSFPSVKPRKMLPFRGELSRIMVILSFAERITEAGSDLSTSCSPVPLLQYLLLCYLPRRWDDEADEPSGSPDPASCPSQRGCCPRGLVKTRTTALKNEICLLPVFQILTWWRWPLKDNQESFLHAEDFVQGYFTMLQSSPEMKPVPITVGLDRDPSNVAWSLQSLFT